ncbi:MAG: family ATPase [Myxococcaceae bacterium]|nr:family ATPase [Myxococcaceae bacterium]
MIRRLKHERALARLLRQSPVVALLGPRQVGKTTLARALARQAKQPVEFFDLERSSDLARLTDPLLVLEPLEGLIVLDEVQLRPELFPTLRVLADRRPLPARFLVLGSASPQLLKQSSESLAGRVAFYDLPGLGLAEVKPAIWKKLWRRGGFPAAFTAPTDDQSWRWREDFVRTFVQTDLPQLGLGVPAPMMLRFWTMLSHVHGQVINYSQLGGSLGVADNTVRRYLDALVQTFMVRALRPWHANLGKREVKSPKVYLRDPGVLHALLGIRTDAALQGSPYAGASFEGFVIEQLIELLGLDERECFFWSTYQGAELDFLVVRDGVRRGFEMKLTVAPSITRSMHIAMEDLKLDQLDVIHAGEHTFQLAPRIRAVAISRLTQDVRL